MRSSFAASTLSAPEPFTSEEAAALAPYFGNTDRPVFVLTDLPEVVKGALFARYSRSAKCEGVSNVLTKVLERGRLMSCLEQSTTTRKRTCRPS